MMDFDIGNLFYIIITLVVVIVGLLGKKKKPAEGASGTAKSKARPGFLENLEQVLQMGQEQPEVRDLHDFEEDLPVEEFTPEPAAEASSSDVGSRPGFDVGSRPSILEEYDRIMKQRPEEELDPFSEEGMRSTKALEVIDLDDYPGTDYFEIIKDFDAGTAVVYSSIINRLDY